MNLHRTRTATLALLFGLVAGACSDDATGPSESLTEAELALLAESLFVLGFDASFDTPPSGAEGPEAAPASFENSIDVTVPCPVSGTVRVEAGVIGTVDGETGAADLDYALDQTHTACVVESEDGSTRIQIDGEPGTAFDYSIDLVEGLFIVDGSLTGNVRYASTDRTGVCLTDLAWSGSGGIEGGNSCATPGTICGISVSTSSSDS